MVYLQMMSSQTTLTLERSQNYQMSTPFSGFDTVLVFAKQNVTALQWSLRLFEAFNINTYLLTFLTALTLLALLTVVDVHLYRYENPISTISQCKVKLYYTSRIAK